LSFLSLICAHLHFLFFVLPALAFAFVLPKPALLLRRFCVGISSQHIAVLLPSLRTAFLRLQYKEVCPVVLRDRALCD
jgi:hypothetical protein